MHAQTPNSSRPVLSRRLRLPLLLAVFAAFVIVPSAASAACFSNPSSCGYPDATNTGVPAGTSLTSSGSVTLSTAGQTLNAVDLTGSVTVTAPNVTIQNSKLHTTSGGSGTRVITLNQGATGFTLKDSEVYGNGSTTNAPQSAVWNHYDNSGAQVLRSYLHGFPDSWEGRIDLFKDSYGVVDAAYSGSHDEIIYICSSTAKVEHSTLINQHGQTATVFGDTICGGGNTFTVTNSLLAGGGYIVYPQANTTGSGGSTNVSGNRIARCKTAEVVNSSGDHLCQSGADQYGLFPNGGKYGYCSGSSSGCAGFSNNVWDDNGACIEGSCSSNPPPADKAADAVWTAPTSAKVGTAVTLNGSASTGDAPITCQWAIETSTGTVQDTRTGCQASYTFQTAGTQSVKLTVTDGDGDTDTNRQSFTVAASTTPPPADKPADAVWTAPTNAKAGTAVTLNGGASTGDAPITCLWSIENSAGSVLATRGGCQASYTFAAAGTQYVKLAVTDVDGDTDTNRQAITVAASTTPPPAETADAVWTAPSNAKVGTPVNLNGTASKGSGAITCTWSFEDATSSTVWETHEGCAINFVFQQADTKYVKLTVADATGDTDSNRQSFPVAAASTPPPADKPAVAVWTAPTSAKAGTAVSLNGSASTGDAPIACQWSIETSGGAVLATRSGCQTSYTFAAGTQYVKLAVTDGDGDTNSSRKSFAVAATGTTPPPTNPPTNPPGQAAQAIWTAPANPRAGQKVTLDGSGSKGDAPLTCTWTSENQSGSTVFQTKTGCKATFTLQTQGVRYYKLTVRDADGSTATLRRAIRIVATRAKTQGAKVTTADSHHIRASKRFARLFL